MINCFSTYYSTEISFPFAIFLFIVIVIFTLYFKISKKNQEESKQEPLYYEKDVLGLEIPVYDSINEDFKPINHLNLKVGLFLVIAVFSMFLTFNSSNKSSKTKDIPRYYYPWNDTKPSFNQAIENPNFPGRYLSDPNKQKIEKSINEKFIEEYYYVKAVN